jgi:4-hydroxy-2-oxoheptanedioate aldolase
MCTFPSPTVVEMLGYLGFDWILLDNEHGSITVDTAESCTAAAELSGMAPIVHPVGNKPEIIAPFLDRGAWGVQVPHVNTAEEARATANGLVVACVITPLAAHRRVAGKALTRITWESGG